MGNEIVKEMQLASDFSTLLQKAFQMNTLLFSSAWLRCVKFADELLTSDTALMVWLC